MGAMVPAFRAISYPHFSGVERLFAVSVKPKKRRDVPAAKIGPRTDISSKRLRKGDLALVEDPKDTRQMYLAKVAGGYCQAGVWYVQLACPDGCDHWVPQSVKARHVTRSWRRRTR